MTAVDTGVNTVPFNRRHPTVGRCRVFWQLFVRAWSRLGEVHYKLSSAPTDEERWRLLWNVDDNGRHISYPWREKRR